MIWVKPSDKATILEKINKHDWAKQSFETLKSRVSANLKLYQNNPKEFLSKLPLEWNKKQANRFPPLLTLNPSTGINNAKREVILEYLQTGIDCGILYFLTDDEKYAQFGADVLYTFVEGMVQLTSSKTGHNGGGLVYPDDHLREAREIGAQIPILYDFVYPYLIKGGKVFDVSEDKKVDFSIQNAEKLFKTYIDLALNRGIIDCNWPILESSSLVGNSLALSSESERKEFLQYYLEKNTPNQDALVKVADFYQKHHNQWPESTNYAHAVNQLTTYLMTLLTRIYPDLHLGNKYPLIPSALPTNYYLSYPNHDQMISFGDGHRDYHADFEAYEIAYHLAIIEKNEVLKKEFGSLLNSSIFKNKYNRGGLKKNYKFAAEVYSEPLQLLWFESEIEGEKKEYPLPTTYNLPFAGIFVQRNLSKDPKNGLMCFVGGASFVHGHATGMNMELYCKGEVLGAESGRATYTTDIHENYYRLFASHNTVVVNGASESEGGWVNLGTNTVQKVAIEPEIGQNEISPNNSFTTTSFRDDKGDKAEATQERTLGIVRTSETTGFYVDIFKSKSDLSPQFHDYIYHNIGNSVEFFATKGNFPLKKDSLRYQESAKKEWVKNKKFRHPGWHFFKDVETSNSYSGNLLATFKADDLDPKSLKMNAFIVGNQDREYTKVMAPPTADSPKPYTNKPTPAIIIRQNGEAWNQPFAVVYEPIESDGSIQSVEKIEEKGQFKGLKIQSLVNGKMLNQWVLNLENEDSIFDDDKLGLHFKGRYAVLTFDNSEKLQSVYIGSGKELTHKKLKISTLNQKSGRVHIDFNQPKPVINAENLLIKY